MWPFLFVGYILYIFELIWSRLFDYTTSLVTVFIHSSDRELPCVNLLNASLEFQWTTCYYMECKTFVSNWNEVDLNYFKWNDLILTPAGNMYLSLTQSSSNMDYISPVFCACLHTFHRYNCYDSIDLFCIIDVMLYTSQCSSFTCILWLELLLYCPLTTVQCIMNVHAIGVDRMHHESVLLANVVMNTTCGQRQ